INVLIKAANVNAETFWQGLFAKALAITNLGSLICNVGAGGPAPAGGPTTSTTALQLRRKWKAKKEEHQESNDNMSFLTKS
ncbi:hypothetical protein DBR06_SOUSAS34210007, partial [Sousa chinensis]